MIKWCKYRHLTTSKLFQRTVARNPHKVCLIHVQDKQQWTFRHVDAWSDAVGVHFQQNFPVSVNKKSSTKKEQAEHAGLVQGDVVHILMENRIEYAPIWLGLTKIGVVSSLINSNLRKESLIHCLKCSTAKALIYDINLAHGIFFLHFTINTYDLISRVLVELQCSVKFDAKVFSYFIEDQEILLHF